MARDMVQVRRGPRKSYTGPDAQVRRSQFNRSHGVKTTFDASRLVPILVDEVLPGDTFTCRLNGFARIFSPLDAPVMDNIELETCFFFVPNRLIWDNWEAFNGAHDDAGAQDTDYTIPTCNSASTCANHSLANYMGVPIGLDFTQVNVSALPFRAYVLIYNEWFRDQNLIDKETNPTDNGPDGRGFGQTDTYVLKSAKKHDYFTSALPYLQKGDPVTAALAGTAPVKGIGKGNNDWYTAVPQTVYESGETTTTQFAASRLISPTDTDMEFYVEGPGATGHPQIYADLTAATGVSINALRESVAIQRLLERDARGGTRYTELIKAHFGVTNPDFRLQRPEYLGGGKAYVNISPVANTSATGTEDQGELRGIGTGVISGHGWAKSFTEHGYIVGLVRARGDITYFQGIDRLWTRSTRYDFYIPALANLGEQSVLNKELYVSNVVATDDAVFAYQERWAEYRTKKSLITGKFNPDVSGALSHWHLAEDFASLPTLNRTFIEDQTPMARVTTVDTEPDFLLDVWFDYKCARPLPVYSVPSLIPRF